MKAVTAEGSAPVLVRSTRAQFFVLLALSEGLLTIALDRLTVTSGALSALPILHGLSPATRYFAIVGLHALLNVLVLTCRIGLATLLLQFVLAAHSVEVPIRPLADSITAAAWTSLFQAATRLLLLATGLASVAIVADTVVPGSLLQILGAPGHRLSSAESAMNFVNPFEAVWITILTWRLQWLKNRDVSPVYIAGLTWLICTLPKWLLVSVIGKLLGA